MTMTTLSNREKLIRFKLENDITVVNERNYKVNLPTINCSTEKDAVYMQSKINEFVNNLSHELLEK